MNLNNSNTYEIFAQIYLKNAISNYEKIKQQGERAISQINEDKDLFWLPGGESNSIATLIKHLAGNMKSRWTNFLTTDGEKPDRNRPSEFDLSFNESREHLMQRWEKGWRITFDALSSLTIDDLLKDVYIRKEKHTVLEAINRQLIHYSMHIGQIVSLAKIICSDNWQSLSIPRSK